jgi:hypothetical protein
MITKEKIESAIKILPSYATNPGQIGTYYNLATDSVYTYGHNSEFRNINTHTVTQLPVNRAEYLKLLNQQTIPLVSRYLAEKTKVPGFVSEGNTTIKT